MDGDIESRLTSSFRFSLQLTPSTGYTIIKMELALQSTQQKHCLLSWNLFSFPLPSPTGCSSLQSTTKNFSLRVDCSANYLSMPSMCCNSLRPPSASPLLPSFRFLVFSIHKSVFLFIESLILLLLVFFFFFRLNPRLIRHPKRHWIALKNEELLSIFHINFTCFSSLQDYCFPFLV